MLNILKRLHKGIKTLKTTFCFQKLNKNYGCNQYSFLQATGFFDVPKHSEEHLEMMVVRKKKLFTTKQGFITQSFQNQIIQCLYPRVSVFLVSESANATEKEREEFPLSC